MISSHSPYQTNDKLIRGATIKPLGVGTRPCVTSPFLSLGVEHLILAQWHWRNTNAKENTFKHDGDKKAWTYPAVISGSLSPKTIIIPTAGTTFIIINMFVRHMLFEEETSWLFPTLFAFLTLLKKTEQFITNTAKCQWPTRAAKPFTPVALITSWILYKCTLSQYKKIWCEKCRKIFSNYMCLQSHRCPELHAWFAANDSCPPTAKPYHVAI